VVRSFSDHFSVLLAQSDEVTLGPVGLTTHLRESARAYRELKALPAEQLAAHRDALEGALRDGSIAAQIYAVFLLHRIDPSAAESHLDKLENCDEPLTIAPGGCVVVSDRAGNLLSRLREWLREPRRAPAPTRAS
jgi:hypothetical protein